MITMFFFHTCVRSFACIPAIYVNIMAVLISRARATIGWTLQAEGAEGDVDKYIIANACVLVGTS